MKPGYKQTDVGVIPEEWEAKAIGSEIDLLTGFPFPSSGYAKSGVRLLRGSNVKRGETDWADEITQYWPAVTRDLTRYTMMAGDLVISMDGSLVGRSYAQLGESDLPALLLQRVARIRATNLNVSYLRQFVGGDQFVKYVDSVKTVTAIPHISPTDIRKFTIPVPPTVDEQRAIAEALSDVDALLGGLDRLIAKKRDLKQAAMQQLLTGQTRLPGFHAEWEDTTLGELATFLSGGTPSRSNDDYWTGDIPWISASSLRCFEIWRSDSNVTRDAVAAGSKMAPVGSSLLLVRGSALHNEILCGLVTKPVCFNQDVKALVPRSHVMPSFLTLFIRGTTENFLSLVSSAGNTAGVLDTKLLKAFAINLPPLPEQTAIASVLTEMDAELAALEQRREKTRALKQAMMQELLTGRTRLVASLGATE